MSGETQQALDRASSLPPVDPSVTLPRKVREAAEAANRFYGQAPSPADAPATPPATPPPATPVPQPITAAPPVATPAPAPATPPPAPATPPPAPADVPPEQWEHRYNSMKGRFDQATQTIGMQGEQLRQMGTELTRMNDLLRQVAPPVPPAQQKLVTDADVQTYGPELVDLMHRAAKEAVTPELATIQRENEQLKQRLNRDARGAVYATLDHDLPEWKSINTNPRFKAWLRLPDVYSGEVRQSLLTRAMQRADAPSVLAFFKGFVTDEQTTGQQLPGSQQPEPAPARVPAVSLETLSAPGRANPATGGTQVPVEKPVYTHAQVSKFYKDVTRGAYVGREQQKEIDEQAIILAGKEGRIR